MTAAAIPPEVDQLIRDVYYPACRTCHGGDEYLLGSEVAGWSPVEDAPDDAVVAIREGLP